MQEVFSIREAARYLHVSISTIRRMIKDGKIKAYKVGAQYRIRKEELDKFFTDAKKPPKP